MSGRLNQVITGILSGFHHLDFSNTADLILFESRVQEFIDNLHDEHMIAHRVLRENCNCISYNRIENLMIVILSTIRIFIRGSN